MKETVKTASGQSEWIDSDRLQHHTYFTPVTETLRPTTFRLLLRTMYTFSLEENEDLFPTVFDPHFLNVLLSSFQIPNAKVDQYLYLSIPVVGTFSTSLPLSVVSPFYDLGVPRHFSDSNVWELLLRSF